MKPPDKDDEALSDAYRKASANDASSPRAAIRNAILAEAQAAARRRTSAANDSRYVWRGVAGVAVLGIAVLLWQKVDHRIPGMEPVTRVELEESKAEEPPPPMTAPMTAPAKALPPQRTPAADSATAAAPERIHDSPRAEEKAQSPAAEPAAVMANTEPRAPAPPAAGGPPPRSAAPVVFGPPASPAQNKMSAEQDAATDADGLLQLHFPQQYQSSAPHRLWLLQDATGAVLRSGELAAGQDLAALRLRLEGEVGGWLRPWRIHSLRNAQGQEIELAIAQTP